MSVKKLSKRHRVSIDAIILLNLVVVFERAVEKPDLLSKIVLGINLFWVLLWIINLIKSK